MYFSDLSNTEYFHLCTPKNTSNKTENKINDFFGWPDHSSCAHKLITSRRASFEGVSSQQKLGTTDLILVKRSEVFIWELMIGQ